MINPHLAGMSWRLTHQSESQRREADEALGLLASRTRRLRLTRSVWRLRTPAAARAAGLLPD